MDSIIKSNGEENDYVQYNELIKNTVDKSQRNEFTRNTALALINSDIFDDRGEMKIIKAEDFFNYGFMSALTGLARKNSPEAELYFNKLSIDSLRKIFTAEELEEIRDYYTKVQSYIYKTSYAIKKGLSKEY